ncbi:hypothetical protein KR222_008820 [Zaprionus bogoriensis]|nr:hypothetical protein KR222_008820 [Zaprionus bogoriensis]
MCSQKQKIKSEKKRQKKLLAKQMKAKQKHDQINKNAVIMKPKKSTPTVSFPYYLYLYRQELRRSSSDFSYLRLARAKIMLTSELISNNIGNCNKLCTVDDLKTISREVQFKKRLTCQVDRLEQFQELGLNSIILNGKKTPL